MQQLAIRLHRWLGLALAIFVVVFGLSGAVLVFRPELDRWLNADLFVIETGHATFSTDELLRRVAAAYPDTRPGEVFYGDRPGEAWRVYTQQLPGSQGRTLEVFVNPHTGEIVGERVHVDAVVTPAPLDRRSIMMYIRRVHFEWLLGETAYRIIGVIAVVWIATSIIGVYLAWPRGGAWRRTLAINLSAGALRGYFDSHRSLGLLSTIVLLPVLITALWWNLDAYFRPLVSSVLPSSAPPHMMGEREASAGSHSPQIAADAIVAKALEHERGARVSRLAFEYEAAQYIVYLDKPRGGRLIWIAHDMNGGGNAMLTYSMDDGHLLHAVNSQTARAGDIYEALQYPLHTGTFFGLLGRLVWLLAALVPAWLAVSGIYVWAKRRRARRSIKV